MTAKSDGTPANPYLAARREWDERYGGYIEDRNMWRKVALLSLGGVLLCIFFMGAMGMQNKLVPFLVEVDELGETVVVGPVEQAGMPDDRIVRAQLGSFIRALRSVTSDATVQKQWLFEAYSMINNSDPAAVFVSEYYEGTGTDPSPFERGKNMLVNVDISTVMPQSESKEFWEVEWKETARDRNGKKLYQEPRRMRSLLQIYFAPPQTMEQILKNPTGVHVKSFSWSEQGR